MGRLVMILCLQCLNFLELKITKIHIKPHVIPNLRTSRSCRRFGTYRREPEYKNYVIASGTSDTRCFYKTPDLRNGGSEYTI